MKLINFKMPTAQQKRNKTKEIKKKKYIVQKRSKNRKNK